MINSMTVPLKDYEQFVDCQNSHAVIIVIAPAIFISTEPLGTDITRSLNDTIDSPRAGLPTVVVDDDDKLCRARY